MPPALKLPLMLALAAPAAPAGAASAADSAQSGKAPPALLKRLPPQAESPADLKGPAKKPAQTLEKIISDNKPLSRKIKRRLSGLKEISKKDIQDFLAENNYFKASVEASDSGYEIKNPIQTIFVIRGNQFFSGRDIRKIIRGNQLKLGRGLYRVIEGAIKAAYQKEGFPQTKIRRKIKKKGWKEWVYLLVSEGPRLRIAELKVSGVFSKPSSEYANFIRNNSSPLIKKGFYRKKDLEAGYKSLIDFLRGQGYLQSKIYPDRARIEGRRVFIKVTLREGPLTIIRDIRLSNIQAFPARLILSRMESKIQAPLRLKALEGDLKKIKELYKSHGYLKMKLMGKSRMLSYEQGGQYANLTIDIDEGPQILVSEIAFEGLKKAREPALRRLLDFKEGGLLTPEKISQSIKDLSEWGLFSGIAIDYEELEKGAERFSRSRAIVSVKEKKPRSIRWGAGLNTERGLTARTYGEFGYRNLFGYGRSVFGKTSWQINLKEKKPFFEYEVSGRYKEVFSPGAGWQGNVSLSRAKSVFTYSSENINFLHKDQIGFFIEKKISKKTSLQLSLWSLEARRENCSKSACPENSQRIGSSSFTLKRDSRGNIFDPAEGSLLAFTGEAASPRLGSSRDISFWKAHFQSHMYFLLRERLVLALMLKGGWISAGAFLPVSRAFILGGQSSLRGYDGNIEGERIPSREAVPIAKANEPLHLASGEKASAAQYGLAKLELRFPLMKSLKGLVFYDAGAAGLVSRSRRLTEFGHSLGAGFRYSAFFMPVGLDIGYKLPPKKGRSYRFHLSIGFF